MHPRTIQNDYLRAVDSKHQTTLSMSKTNTVTQCSDKRGVGLHAVDVAAKLNLQHRYRITTGAHMGCSANTMVISCTCAVFSEMILCLYCAYTFFILSYRALTMTGWSHHGNHCVPNALLPLQLAFA